MKRLAVMLGVLLATRSVHANSRLPATNQLVVAPDNPSVMLLRSTFGFLFTQDAGKTWTWLCESAIPCMGQQDPAVSLLNGGFVMSGQVEGLAVSPNLGCSWSFVPGTAQQLVVDVTRTRDGTTGFGIENVYSSTSDAGVLLYDTTVLRTTDVGKTWQPLAGAIDPTLVIHTIDVAPSDTTRIYVTGIVFGQTHAEMLVSKDSGQTYAEFPIPLVGSELGAYIAAVDPNVADTVYVRTLGLDKMTGLYSGRVLVSTDGGQTFAQKWSGDRPQGFALSQDGTRVYVGSVADGLQVAGTSDFAFTQTSKHQIQCLAMSGTTLYACGNEAESGFILGSTTDEGATFTPVLRLETIAAPIACSPGTQGATCGSQWPALAEQLAIDAGLGDAGTSPPPSSSCGCQAQSPQDVLWALPLGLYLVTRRRRSDLERRQEAGKPGRGGGSTTAYRG